MMLRPPSSIAVRSARCGFTLIEVLVALVILSVMAAMAWKGMDGITRAREVAEGRLKQTLRLQSVMSQWDADMAAVIETDTVDGGQFYSDGSQQLRFTRTATGGVQVVVWTLRQGRLERWAAPAVTRVGELESQWTQASQLSGTEPGTLLALKGVDQLQVQCYPKRAPGQGVASNLTNCGTTRGVAPGVVPGVAPGAAQTNVVPEAIRVVLTLGAGSGFEGRLTREIFVAPQGN